MVPNLRRRDENPFTPVGYRLGMGMRRDDQAALVAEALRAVLGDGLLGLYLHGSSVIGGLKPHSDIDLMAVIARPMGDGEKHDLLGRLLSISKAGRPDSGRRPVELFVLVQSQVRPWRYPPALDLLYGDWWRAEYERGEFPWHSPDPDLAIQIDVAVRADRAVVGPPIGELLDAPPAADVRRAMIDSIPALLSYLDGDEANVLLTFARTWFSLATGAIAPKDTAAEWAIERLPRGHGAALAHARSIYLGEIADDWAGRLAGVRPCVEAMLAEISVATGPAAGAESPGLTPGEPRC